MIFQYFLIDTILSNQLMKFILLRDRNNTCWLYLFNKIQLEEKNTIFKNV